MTQAREILLSFIADEDAAMKRIEQGEFYTYHHADIVKLIPRAGRLLDDDDLVSFYFHLLRLDILPLVKRDEDYALLRAAYEALTPLQETEWRLCALRRATGLLVFGHDGKWALSEQPAATLESYLYYRKLWAQVNAYVSIPTMLDKKQRFQAYTDDQALCLRILRTLRAVRYCVDDGSCVTTLWFWGLVFALVLERRLAEAVLADMTALCGGSADGLERLALLQRYLAAAGWDDLAASVDALVTVAGAA